MSETTLSWLAACCYKTPKTNLLRWGCCKACIWSQDWRKSIWIQKLTSRTDFLCKTESFSRGSVTKGRQICQEFLQSGNGDTDLQIEFKQENGTETVNESDINETTTAASTTTTSRVIEQNATKHDLELPGFLLAESDPALIKILIADWQGKA